MTIFGMPGMPGVGGQQVFRPPIARPRPPLQRRPPGYPGPPSGMNPPGMNMGPPPGMNPALAAIGMNMGPRPGVPMPSNVHAEQLQPSYGFPQQALSMNQPGMNVPPEMLNRAPFEAPSMNDVGPEGIELLQLLAQMGEGMNAARLGQSIAQPGWGMNVPGMNVLARGEPRPLNPLEELLRRKLMLMNARGPLRAI